MWLAILVWGAVTPQFNCSLDTVGLGYSSAVCCTDSNSGFGLHRSFCVNNGKSVLGYITLCRVNSDAVLFGSTEFLWEYRVSLVYRLFLFWVCVCHVDVA